MLRWIGAWGGLEENHFELGGIAFFFFGNRWEYIIITFIVCTASFVLSFNVIQKNPLRKETVLRENI